MDDTLFGKVYNPDVLSCLANLSSDEVFTPPEIVNQMLDMLPQDIFKNPATTFLDPACKTGVFLREIAKRLITGLESQIPDLQERVNHIFHKQLFGIAITELTSLLARRGVYCSKSADGAFSVSRFATAEGNIRYKKIKHTWKNGKCIYCGASQSEYERGDELESHAYEFIHTDDLEKIFNMKFDVIISNPPYQLKVNDSGHGLGAIPLYHKFLEQMDKLNPRYISMIIPSRWFSGGVGLEDFRKNMLNDHRLKIIVDFIDSKDCFPGVDINGGVCYFLIDNSYNGECLYKSNNQGKISEINRNLSEFDIFIRFNESLSIIHKVCEKNEIKLSEPGGCSPQTPYGFLSTFNGAKNKTNDADCEILSSRGWSYVAREKVLKSVDTIDKYKPMISKLSCEHAGNPDKNGMYRVLSRMEILKPNQICNQSYLTVCAFDKEIEAQHCFNYLRTKFVRFLIQQTLIGMNISISNFRFVPTQDFSKPWTDAELYAKYNLTQEEIDFIESMIRPMEENYGKQL